MIHGERLTEYTSEELQTLLNAVAREMDFVYESEKDPRYDLYYFERLEQWKVKIIEAKSEVIIQERIVNN